MYGSVWAAVSVCLMLVAILCGCATSSIDPNPTHPPSYHRVPSSPGGVSQRGWYPTQAQPDLPSLDEESSLRDYLAYAALNNAGLRAAFERWKVALERIPQVRSLPDPRFTYGFFIRKVETRVGPQRHRFGISQMFPWFGKLRLRGDAAWEAAEAARERYEAQKLKLFYTVKVAYYEYYYLGRAIAVVREQRDLLKYLEEVVRTRYMVAAAQHADVIRAQVELGKLDDRLRTLQDLQGPIVARLNAALNRRTSAELPWPAKIAEEEMQASDEQILTWSRENSPELKEFDHKIAKEQHAIQLARKHYYPDIMLGVDYIETGSAIMDTPDSGKDPVIAMASINLPIWFGKLRAGVREAEARRRVALRAKRDRENWLSSEIRMVLYRFRDAERKIDLYRDTLVPKGKQSLKASETAFRAGTASFLDVMDAIRILLEFELSYERALADHAQRLAQVEMLVGRQIPRASPVVVEEGGENVPGERGSAPE